MTGSFTLKTVRIVITLGKGVFSAGGNTKVIEGLACAADILKPGLPEKNSAGVKVWGLKYEDMAQLTMLSFHPLEKQLNLIEVYAGERGGRLPLAFQGEIVGAFADFNAAPDVMMQFEAESGGYPQLIADRPVTTDGEAQADKLFAQFAAEANYAYKNEGVSASVRNAWFSGSPIDKMTKLAREIGCELILDDNTVIVLPAGAARSGTAVSLAADSGLIGYPTFNSTGIVCRCLYNPDLQYGGLIQVKSIVPRSSGVWKIIKLTHALGAYQPDAKWETQIEAVYID